MDLTDYLNKHTPQRGENRGWTVMVPPNSQVITCPTLSTDGAGILVQLVRDIPEGMAPEDASKALVSIQVIEPEEEAEVFPEGTTALSGKICTSIALSHEAAVALIMCLEQSLADAEQDPSPNGTYNFT